MAGFLNHIWYKLLDEEGVPIDGATVFLYEYTNPTTKLKLVDSVGTSAANPLTTDANGVFEFYVKDHIKANSEGGYGYEWDQQFIISWNKPSTGESGIIRGDHLFGEFESVSLSGSSTVSNKAISDFIGWTLREHSDFMFGTTPRCGSSSSSSSSSSISSSSSESLSSSSESLSSSSSSLMGT